jgi:hypothetical protein
MWNYNLELAKNGKRYLVSDGNYIVIAFWNTDPTIWEDHEKITACWTVWDCEDFYYSYHLLDDPPKAWMELPKPC